MADVEETIGLRSSDMEPMFKVSTNSVGAAAMELNHAVCKYVETQFVTWAYEVADDPNYDASTRQTAKRFIKALSAPAGSPAVSIKVRRNGREETHSFRVVNDPVTHAVRPLLPAELMTFCQNFDAANGTNMGQVFVNRLKDREIFFDLNVTSKNKIPDKVESDIIKIAYKIANDPRSNTIQKADAKRFLKTLQAPAGSKTGVLDVTLGRKNVAFRALDLKDLTTYCQKFDNANGTAFSKDLEKLKKSAGNFPKNDAERLEMAHKVRSAIEVLAPLTTNCLNFKVDSDMVLKDDIEEFKATIQRELRTSEDVNLFLADTSYTNFINANGREPVYYEAERVHDAYDIADDFVDMIKKERLSPLAKYMLIYDFVTQRPNIKDEEGIDMRSFVGVLATETMAMGPTGRAKLLEYMCSQLGDPRLKVQAVDGFARRVRDKASYAFCKVVIDDDESGLKGEYIADPEADAALLPEDDVESGILSDTISYAGERLAKVTSKIPRKQKNGSDRLRSSMVLNALIPPQIAYQYNVGKFFDFAQPAPRNAAEAVTPYMQARNTNVNFANYSEFPTEKQYRKALDAGFAVRYSDRSTAWRQREIEGKVYRAGMAAKINGSACFKDKDWEDWNKKINKYRRKDNKKPVADTAWSRAVNHYSRALRLDRVHVALRAALTDLVYRVEGFADYLMNTSTAAPAPTATP